jgi:outer membrane protein
VLWALGAASGAQAQSLVELYEAARGYDASFLSARSQVEATMARAEQAKAGLRPQAGLAAAANWSRRDSSAAALDATSNSQNIGLSASQPLYRPANQIASEQGALSIDIARAQLQAAEQDLIVRTTQAYFDVLAAQDTLTFVKAQKTAVSEQLAAAKRNFEVGTSTVTDSREAQARFDLVSAQEIAAENDLRVKKLALDQLVGKANVEPRPLATPVVLPALVPADPQAWVGQAETTHPSVLQATRGLEIARLETRKAEAGHKPTLDLVGQYQIARAPSGSPAIPGNVRNNTASVGLQFNMPLYTGGAVQNRVVETLALEEKARTDLEAAKRGVGQATRSAYFGVLSGQGQVKALEAAELSSQSALDANKLGYQVGVRINIDVLNAQSQLFQTKRDLAVARYNVLIGGLRLRQASGQLKAEDLQPVNALLVR